MARYIDADLLWKALDVAHLFDEGNPRHIAQQVVEEQPTADVVEVKRGYWIPVPSSDMSTGKAYKCSECDKMRYGCRLPPYCQECGAKMDGERKCDNG